MRHEKGMQGNTSEPASDGLAMKISPRAIICHWTVVIEDEASVTADDEEWLVEDVVSPLDVVLLSLRKRFPTVVVLERTPPQPESDHSQSDIAEQIAWFGCAEEGEVLSTQTSLSKTKSSTESDCCTYSHTSPPCPPFQATIHTPRRGSK
jgi:hypothetical protein